MKVKKFFKKLNSEIDGVIPALSDELKNAPICVREGATEMEECSVGNNKKINFKEFFTPRKLAYFATAFVVAFVAIFGTISFVNNTSVSDNVIVRLDINPSLEFELDEDMKVEKVVSDNADGDLILKVEGFVDSLIGLDFKVAVKEVALKASELGFIDYRKTGENGEYNAINVSATGNAKKLPKNLLSDMQSYVIDEFNKKGIFLYVGTSENTAEDFEEMANKMHEQSVLYLENIKQNAISLNEYLTELIFDYCNVLLNHSINKYDLLNEIDALNDQIVNAQDSLFADDYWSYGGENEEILALMEQMKAKLDEFSQKYDEVIESDLALSVKLGSYEVINIESLRVLAQNVIDETFFSVENEYIVDFGILAGGTLINEITNLYNDFVSGAIANINQAIETIVARVEEVRYNANISPKLTSITDEEYQSFIDSINK